MARKPRAAEKRGQPEAKERPSRVLVCAIVLAVVLPVAHAWFLRGSPAYDTPIIDSAEYVDTAKELLSGAPSPAAYFHSPLYSWLLALVFQVLGVRLDVVRVLQALLNGLTCLTLYAIGVRLFSR